MSEREFILDFKKAGFLSQANLRPDYSLATVYKTGGGGKGGPTCGFR
jgi:hypothetical protein